jgi:hypothetical protein
MEYGLNTNLFKSDDEQKIRILDGAELCHVSFCNPSGGINVMVHLPLGWLCLKYQAS